MEEYCVTYKFRGPVAMRRLRDVNEDQVVDQYRVLDSCLHF